MDNSGLLSTTKLNAYWRLMRADKPIGIFLLLWPCVWAMWIASAGFPSLHILVVFVLGVVVMRSAGCVINDYADRNVDGFVERSSARPLVTGEVTEKEALGLFFFTFIFRLNFSFDVILADDTDVNRWFDIGHYLSFYETLYSLASGHTGCCFQLVYPNGFCSNRAIPKLGSVVVIFC
jgi:heme O synthase-like polyprenyltransferase